VGFSSPSRTTALGTIDEADAWSAMNVEWGVSVAHRLTASSALLRASGARNHFMSSAS